MRLIVVHQILIASAIGLAVIFGVRSIVMFSKSGTGDHVLLAALSVAVAVALGLYLWKVRARLTATKRAPSPT
jgi:hypothetical protein